MNDYPFTSVLSLMKPSKINPDNPKHVAQLKACYNSPDYCWEEKLDGINIMAIGGRLFSNKVSKKTGWPTEKTMHFPQISKVLLQYPKLIFNGELYEVGKKSNYVTSFSNLNEPADALSKQEELGYLKYHVYDILRDTDGTWLVTQPYEKRRARLEEIFAECNLGDYIVLNPSHDCSVAPADEHFEDIIARGYEGVVLKRKDGLYFPGKRPMWVQVKMKASMEDDVVIMGFNEATRKYTGKDVENWPYWDNGEPVTSNWYKGLIGSIRVGKYNKEGELVFVGNVTGIEQWLREDMTENPNTYIGQVLKIKAMEKTEDGMYRHANFLELHDDKNPRECRLEEND